MISNSVICGVSSWLSSLIHSKHFFFILKLYSPAFSLGVAISLALFCPLKFPLLPISFKQSHLKILHLYRVKEDVSHYLNFLPSSMPLLLFLFYFTPRRWMQIWQLSFDTAGSFCGSENGPVGAGIHCESLCADEQFCVNIQSCSYFQFYNFFRLD